MDLDHAHARARRVRDLYDELNGSLRGRTWTREEYLLGFVGDVGDLAKLVAAREGARDIPGGKDALGHELADCLWSVLTLAEIYDVDLAGEFDRCMDDLETHLRDRLAAGAGRLPPGLP